MSKAPVVYIGISQLAWFKRSDFDGVRVFISMNSLDKYTGDLPDPRGTIAAIDSGGFTELKTHGKWRTTPEQYADKCRRVMQAFGSRVEWFSPQDWMCEPVVIKGGKTKDGVFKGTGLSVEEHQRRTVENYIALRRLLGEKLILVVQGNTLFDYWRCLEMYADAGIDLRNVERVGVGSVCRRQNTNEATLIMKSIATETGGKLHGFGFKSDGIVNCAAELASADTFAWSFAGRRRPDVTHEHYLRSSRFVPANFNKRGCADDCSQCPEYCLTWRKNLLRDIHARLAMQQRQCGFFFEEPRRWSTDTIRTPA